MFKAHHFADYWFQAMHDALNQRNIYRLPPSNNADPSAKWLAHFNSDVEKFLSWQVNGSSLPTPIDVQLWQPYNRSGLPALEKHVDRRRLAIGFSGGIDSTLAAIYAQSVRHYLPHEVVLVHVDYGAPYALKELDVSQRVYERCIGPSIASMEQVSLAPHGPGLLASKLGKGYIVPLRNTLLACVAGYFADEVWIVGNYRPNDAAPGAAIDKGRRFYGEVSGILSRQYMRPIHVSSPFLHLSKADTVRWFASLKGVDQAIGLIETTTSCYHPTHQRCGLCSSCAKLAMMCEDLKLNLPSLDLDFVSEQSQFAEYIQRERAKGRKIPERWSHL